MFPTLNIFGAAMPTAPLIVLIGIWLGSSLAEKHAARHKVNPSHLYNLTFTLLIAYILGGRLSYAAQHPAAFIADPASLVSRNFGLFDPLGGFIIALISGAVYGQRKQLSLRPTLDALTPALAVLMLSIPLANFASGNAFGAPSSLPWAVHLWGLDRHPVQLYEALAAGGILYWLWPSRRPSPTTPGTEFLLFTAASAASRLIFEGLRGSSPVLFLGLRTWQLAAWFVLAAALFGVYYLHYRQPEKEAKSG